MRCAYSRSENSTGNTKTVSGDQKTKGGTRKLERVSPVTHCNDHLSSGEHAVCVVTVSIRRLCDFMVHACMPIAREVITNVWEIAFVMLDARALRDFCSFP